MLLRRSPYVTERKPTGRTAARTFPFAAWAILATGSLLPAHAQYVGCVDTNQDTNCPHSARLPRCSNTPAISLKPTASRLVPIAVWDGERYQPGGLYLAQPVPLTVESGTQYVLQVAGTPKGLFDVKAASDVGGSWIAIGNFQKPAAPNYAKLKRSRNLPRIVSDIDNDKPHFAHRPARLTPAAPQPEQKPAPRPTRRLSIPTGPRCINDPILLQARRLTPEPLPRPTCPRHPSIPIAPSCTSPPESKNNGVPAMGGAPETAPDAIDPDRPHLEYGRPADLESLDGPSPVQIAKLSGHPENSSKRSQPSPTQVNAWRRTPTPTPGPIWTTKRRCKPRSKRLPRNW